MGGINPQRGPRPRPRKHKLTELTQEISNFIFKGASSFFAAQANLEDAVLKEGRDEPIDMSLINSASNSIGSSLLHLKQAKELLEENSDLIKEEGTWHQPYFESVHSHLSNLIDSISVLNNLIPSNSLQTAAESGELQDSMWVDGENSEIRNQSITFLNEMNKLLFLHIEFVVITNFKNPTFLK